jgi:hypothetical protein
MSEEGSQTPISLAQRRAWDATLRWLFSPLDPSPDEDTISEPTPIRAQVEPIDLDREREARSRRHDIA